MKAAVCGGFEPKLRFGEGLYDLTSALLPCPSRPANRHSLIEAPEAPPLHCMTMRGARSQKLHVRGNTITYWPRAEGARTGAEVKAPEENFVYLLPMQVFWGTDRLLTRPKGAHTRPLTSHRLDPVGRHRDNPANGTKTQSHSTVGRPRHRERQGGRVGGVGLQGEDVVDKVLLIMLGSSPPRRSIRAGEGGGLGQRQGGGVPRHSSCCRWLPLRGAISVVLCGS